MTEKLLAWIVDERKWLAASMSIALVSVGAVWLRAAFRALPPRRRIVQTRDMLRREESDQLTSHGAALPRGCAAAVAAS